MQLFDSHLKSQKELLAYFGYEAWRSIVSIYDRRDCYWRLDLSCDLHTVVFSENPNAFQDKGGEIFGFVLKPIRDSYIFEGAEYTLLSLDGNGKVSFAIFDNSKRMEDIVKTSGLWAFDEMINDGFPSMLELPRNLFVLSGEAMGL